MINYTKEKNQKEGFRLQYLEIYNWGTFDEKIWKLQPNGNNSLLTGANGSGKTTLVDAIITLLVPPTKRHYNQSSGTKNKRERDENTYTRGAYVTVQGESGLAAKTKYLRDRNTFSILLGTFYNADVEEYLTLVQVRWYGNNDLKRVYLIVPTALTISEHFQPMDTGGAWKRLLKKKYQAEEFSSFSKYSQRFSKMVGLKSEKALSLFAQTVGIKVLGNLNDFIRQNMLEANNAEEEFQKLYEHYENLLRAHKTIEKAREQMRLLEPIMENGKQYQNYKTKLTRLQRIGACITPFFAKEKIRLFTEKIQKTEKDIQKKSHRVSTLKLDLENLDTQRSDLQISISTNKAYEQIQNLEKQIQQAEQERSRREIFAKRYNDIAEELDFKINPNEKTFYKTQTQSQREKEDIEISLEDIQDGNIKLQIKLERIQSEIKEKELHLTSLQKRQNRIPREQILIRTQLLKKLNLKEKEMPFAAELFKVKDKEKEWEGLLEKMFRNIGLLLLVKEEHYEAVLSFVHETNQDGKITFLKVPALVMKKTEAKLAGNSILQKLAFKENNDWADWLQQHLKESHNYTFTRGCIDLQKHRKAVNEKGLIKNQLYYERNNRAAENRAEYYILGWDNHATILLLQRQIKEFKNEASILQDRIKSAKREQSRLRSRRDALIQLNGFQQFNDIDWKASARLIKHFQEEKNTLLNSSNQLKDLEQQLQEVKKTINEKEEEKEKIIEQRGVLQNRLQNYHQKEKEAREILSDFEEAEIENQRKAIMALISEAEQNFIASTIDRLETRVLKSFRQNQSKQTQKLSSTERKLIVAMQNFTQPKPEIMQLYPDWTAETIELLPDITYLGAFEKMYKKIKGEDLPKYQKRFKEWLNNQMIFDIANFKTALENKESQIFDSIETINNSLREINFNNEPPSYIQLDINKTRDASIRDFKQMLKDAMPDPTKLIKGDEQELEHSFKKIKRIIEELAANEIWRKKVTDVRNWLEFAADERYREDNSQRQYYVDSQSLSGGEKAKLAYTILASAIAYQFGIRNEGRRAKSFRFAVVDEAFSKVDPENSVYAMELFKQLNLQLMVVTPLDKINVAEPYIRSVHFVQNKAKRNSEVFDLPMEVYERKKESFK